MEPSYLHQRIGKIKPRQTFAAVKHEVGYHRGVIGNFYACQIYTISETVRSERSYFFGNRHLLYIDNVNLGFYVRSANVTALVKAAKSGFYSLEGVLSLIEALDSRTLDTNHAGRTLAVVYENPAMPLRNMTVWAGGALVSPAAGSTTVAVSNFLTPEVTPVAGTLFVSAQEGETARHTVVVTNNSKAKLYNMFFTDTMSEGASYEPASVSVNGVDKPLFDPVAGFNLPDMEPDDAKLP